MVEDRIEQRGLSWGWKGGDLLTDEEMNTESARLKRETVKLWQSTNRRMRWSVILMVAAWLVIAMKLAFT